MFFLASNFSISLTSLPSDPSNNLPTPEWQEDEKEDAQRVDMIRVNGNEENQQ